MSPLGPLGTYNTLDTHFHYEKIPSIRDETRELSIDLNITFV